MKDRIVWIDWAKVIGIYLVVLGHLPLNANIVTFIYSFHIPLFFFLSGYLYKVPDCIKSNFRYNICSLIIPYLLLYCIYWIYPIAKGLINNTFGWTEHIIKPFYGLCLGNGYSGTDYVMLNIPLYFLIALFWVRVLFYFYDHIIVCFKVITILGCLVFIYVENKIGIDFYFSIDSAIMAFPFFAIGNLLSQKKMLICFTAAKWKVLLLFIVTIFLEFFCACINGRVDINHCLYGLNLFLFYISAIVGILMVIAFCSLWVRQAFIQTLSNGTMLVIAFGTASASFILFVIKKCDINTDIKSLLGTFGALILLYPIIKLVQRYFPVLLGKSKR